MEKKTPFIFLVLFSSLFILFFYHDALFHPDNYLFSGEGDGLKNYFTYCFHIKHDVSYINFEGMNYPYGELFLYTDCHPVIATTLKFLSSSFPGLAEHSIGILNFIMILSVFLTFFVCYFLLKEFKINNWLSVMFGIGITVLAPQIFRMGGHLALSYSVAIPLSWLLLLKVFKDKKKLWYTGLLFLNNLFWLFIHSYLGIIILFFLIIIVVVQFLSDENKSKSLLNYFGIFCSVCFPILIFYVFAMVTDTHTGRTENPSGFFQYNAEPDDIFLPHHPPLKPLFDELSNNVIKQEWEAWSYVGFCTTIIFITLIILLILQLIKKNKTSLLKELFNSKLLNASLISAGIVLLFAMAFPFKQIDGLIDLIPIIKPFRATGRFAWPFYFVALVFSANVIQTIYYRLVAKQKKLTAILLCTTVGSFNILEGIPYHIDNSDSIIKSKNLFKKEFLSAEYQKVLGYVDPANFQAIITLPFYYQGSESYSRPRHNETVKASFILSYYTGIPIVCANLTRTSIEESKRIVQIVSPDFYTKKIQYDIKSTKPFLVIRIHDNITAYEKEILQKCKVLYSSEKISIYSLQPEDLFHYNPMEVYEKYRRMKSGFYNNQTFRVSRDSAFLYYDGFETRKSEQIYRGTGGFQSVKRGQNIFAQFPPNTFTSGTTYDVSLWMYNGNGYALNDWLRFIIEERDSNETIIESTTWFPEQSETINGNWSLIEGTFKIKDPKNKIYITTIGKDNSKEPLYADDLLIKENGVDVYKLISEDELFYNNHRVVK